jgi:hypothetical protein
MTKADLREHCAVPDALRLGAAFDLGEHARAVLPSVTAFVPSQVRRVRRR